MARIDLDKLSYAIKDLEGRIRSVRAGAGLAERELFTLLAVEASLIENIAVLKTKEVITLAHEFKKAVNDLATCRRKLVFARIDRETYSKALSDQENLMSDLKRQYLKGLDEQENNVIKVDFRRKNG